MVRTMRFPFDWESLGLAGDQTERSAAQRLVSGYSEAGFR